MTVIKTLSDKIALGESFDAKWEPGIQKIRLEVEKYPEIELDIKEIDNAFQIKFINTAYEKAYDEQVPNKYRTSKTSPFMF